MSLPSLVAHADWSVDPKKRWVSRATLRAGQYVVDSGEMVRDASRLLSSLRQGESASVVGFDFSIGLPVRYAKDAGIEEFPGALRQMGTGRWSEFFDIAENPQQISLQRPFYPHRSHEKGTAHRSDLERGLGMDYFDLLRLCERPFSGRGGASCLFWLVGGQQVGRATIHGWREVLQPAIRGDDIGIWPFDGDLDRITETHQIAVAETYPAEMYRHAGFPRHGWSKRRQSDRARRGAQLIEWSSIRGVGWNSRIAKDALEGFGSGASGEDPFDSVVALVGMLDVLTGGHPQGPPSGVPSFVETIEGWVLGQIEMGQIEMGQIEMGTSSDSLPIGD